MVLPVLLHVLHMRQRVIEGSTLILLGRYAWVSNMVNP